MSSNITKVTHIALTSMLLTSSTVAMFLTAPAKANASFEDGSSYCLTTSDSDSSSDSSSNSDDNNNTGGDVQTPKGKVSQSTVDNIKKIAQHMNDEYGFGENQLAIIMSVGLRESTWQLDAENKSGQVAGLFQWGYGSTNGDRITPAGVNPDKLDVDATIKILDYEIKGGKNAQTTSMVGLMKKAGNDKSKAFVAWAKYEGVDVTDGQSNTDAVISWADDVAKILGTDSMKINQSKIDALPSSDNGNSNSDTNDSGTTTDVSDDSICGTASDTDATDGTGSVKSKGAWKRDDVPADVKQFTHDPEKAGLEWHGTTNWLSGITAAGGQCTDFAESYFNLIWGLKMSSGVKGDGKDVAKAMADRFNGQTTSTPKAGAIGSVPAFKGGTGAPGHVLIVQHVLENGDIIVAEQNFSPLSGQDGNNEFHSWNFRLISKASYSGDNYVFYAPKDGKLNWGN